MALSKPQLEVAGAVAGNRELVLVVGPAGTGKTSALAPAVEQLRADGRAVFGVAPSAAAAEVLAVDAGLAADTLDKLLVEHRLDRPPDHRYDLPPGATVVVDEAAMVSTPKLAELAELADARGWRLALVGDPLQFSAVGRSGMFGHLVDCHGAIELDRVHRFANDWERDASLALRRGDTEVLDLYDHHGRLHGGTARQMEEAVVDAWWQARTRGETRGHDGAHQRDGGGAQPPSPGPAGGGRRDRHPRAVGVGRRLPALPGRRGRHPPQRPGPAHRPGPDGQEPRPVGGHRRPPGRRHRRPAARARSAFPPTTWPSTWSWPTPRPATPTRAAPSTAPCCSSTAPPTPAASTSP